jgi:excisionase family DNA binding protein
MTETLLTYPEAAARLRVSRRTLERLVADCEIGHFREGRLVRFTERHITEHLRDHEVRATRRTA